MVAVRAALSRLFMRFVVHPRENPRYGAATLALRTLRLDVTSEEEARRRSRPAHQQRRRHAQLRDLRPRTLGSRGRLRFMSSAVALRRRSRDARLRGDQGRAALAEWLRSEFGGLARSLRADSTRFPGSPRAPEATTASVEDVEINLGGSIRMTRLALPRCFPPSSTPSRRTTSTWPRSHGASRRRHLRRRLAQPRRDPRRAGAAARPIARLAPRLADRILARALHPSPTGVGTSREAAAESSPQRKPFVRGC
jgi:hypothetical protein